MGTKARNRNQKLRYTTEVNFNDAVDEYNPTIDLYFLL